MKLANYITGKWIEGDGEGQLLFNAVNGNPVASATTQGLDFKSMLEYDEKSCSLRLIQPKTQN